MPRILHWFLRNAISEYEFFYEGASGRGGGAVAGQVAHRRGLLLLRFAGVLGVFAGLWEIGIVVLEQRVLIPVAELSVHGSVALLLWIFLFNGALKTVLILVLVHCTLPV